MRGRAAFLLAVLALPACEGRPRPKGSAPTKGEGLVEIDLRQGLPEQGSPSLFGPSVSRSHADLVRLLRELEREDGLEGVFVKLGAASIPLARAAEAGRMLGRIRAKKPVHCHADGYDKGTLLLASLGCTRTWLSPAGSVEVVPIAAQLLYGKRLLDTLKVRADFLQIGKFKGFEEPFTREGPSPEARASIENALGAQRAAYLEGVAAGRGKPSVAASLEDGPFAAEQAKALGLVDEVGYVDEAEEATEKLVGKGEARVVFGRGGEARRGPGIVELVRSISGAGESGVPHVTVLRAVGAITMASGGGVLPFGGSDGITERDLGRELERLAEDDSTRAVVLRVDSPGGSALASDLLWRRLMKLREKKPLVVSVGGMAASGGYYLACAGTKVFAEPSSILGSIGVAGGKFSVGEALEQVGVTHETISPAPGEQAAARAAYASPLEPWDEATKARVRASMQATYDLFLRRIAEGRGGMPLERVAESAEGRLFGGAEAKARGLVDELGGLDEAITLALSLGKLPADGKVEIAGDAPGLLGLLGADAAQSEETRARAAARAWLGEGGGLEGALGPEARHFAASFSPLAAGEPVVAALPFVLRIR